MKKEDKMPKWRTVLGGIIGLFLFSFVMSFVIGTLGIPVPEFLIGPIMLGFIGYGCYKGFVRDFKKYKEKYPEKLIKDNSQERPGTVTSIANYISYEDMHSAIDGAKDFAEDLDKDKFRKLTKSNRKEWAWDNIEKEHAIEVLKYPITANLVRDGVFNLARNEIIVKKTDMQSMLDELNAIAKEYCGFDTDQVFDISGEGASALFLEKDGAYYNVWFSNTSGEKIRSRCHCTKEEAFAIAEGRLFYNSPIYTSSAGGSYHSDLFPELKWIEEKEYEVYEIGEKQFYAGQGDGGVAFNYLCKDLLTGKMIRITEDLNWSVYGGTNYSKVKDNIMNGEAIPLVHVTYSCAKITVDENVTPIAVAKLPLTINLAKMGKMSL